eukprot:jgi/Mesen1/3391/ME000192S02556
MAINPVYAGHWPSPLVVDGSSEEIRTIFILGFPPDVKERELHNLLRWWPEFEASQMNFKGDQPMGFALFSSATMAMAARDSLQNLVFDAELNSVLRVEMAKKNLFMKQGSDESKRTKALEEMLPAYPLQNLAPSRFVPGAPPAWTPQSYVPPPLMVYGQPQPQPQPQPQQQQPQYAAYSPPPIPICGPAGYAPVRNNKDNPPCNTLFIGNLGESTSEAEVRSLFSSQPGFRQMKVLRQNHGTVCFIELADVSSAIAIHAKLQGAVLTSSDRGGMRIQYSKNPFGRKNGMPSSPLNHSPEETSAAMNGGTLIHQQQQQQQQHNMVDGCLPSNSAAAVPDNGMQELGTGRGVTAALKVVA